MSACYKHPALYWLWGFVIHHGDYYKLNIDKRLKFDEFRERRNLDSPTSQIVFRSCLLVTSWISLHVNALSPKPFVSAEDVNLQKWVINIFVYFSAQYFSKMVNALFLYIDFLVFPPFWSFILHHIHPIDTHSHNEQRLREINRN